MTGDRTGPCSWCERDLEAHTGRELIECAKAKNQNEGEDAMSKATDVPGHHPSHIAERVAQIAGKQLGRKEPTALGVLDAVTASRFDRLREPFPAETIGKLPRVTCSTCSKAEERVCSRHTKTKCNECGNYISTQHIHLDYVGHAAVTDRLLEVDPMWSWYPMALDERGLPVFDWKDDHPVGMWIRLTVLGVTRLGYGSVTPNTFEAEKQLIGDAIRSAAMRFGVALNLWSKEDLHTVRQQAEETSGETGSDEDDERTDPDKLWELQARVVGLPTEVQTFLRERWKETTALAGQRIDRLRPYSYKHAEALVTAFEKVARAEHDWKRERNWREHLQEDLSRAVASFYPEPTRTAQGAQGATETAEQSPASPGTESSSAGRTDGEQEEKF